MGDEVMEWCRDNPDLLAWQDLAQSSSCPVPHTTAGSGSCHVQRAEPCSLCSPFTCLSALCSA